MKTGEMQCHKSIILELKTTFWSWFLFQKMSKQLGENDILLINIIVMVMSIITKHDLWQKVIVNNKVVTIKTHTNQILD